MSIRATCPTCGTSFLLPEPAGERQVYCQACETACALSPDAGPECRAADTEPSLQLDTTEAAALAADRARPRAAWDGLPPERGWRGRLLGLLAAAGVAALIAALVFAGWLLWWYLRARPFLRPKPSSPAPRPSANAPDELPYYSSIPPLPAARIAWSVHPDPGPRGAARGLGKDVAKLLPPGGKVRFPSTPGAHALVYTSDRSGSSIQVLDLAAAQEAPICPGTRPLVEPLALSPDGRRLAGRIPAASAVGVWSVADARQVGRVELGSDMSQLDYLDFAGPGRLLTAGTSRVHVWDIATGRPVGTIVLPPWAAALALSPGRKYLACEAPDPGRVCVYDLDTRAKAGEADIPPPDVLGCLALTFSPDGRELAGLFDCNARSRIIVWDMASGKPHTDLTLLKDLRQLVPQANRYAGAALEWLPGRDGWLAYGQLLIDRASGLLLWRAPTSPEEVFGPSRVLDDEHVAAVWPDGLHVLTLPRQEISAVRQASAAITRCQGHGLPPARPAELAEARRVPADRGPIAWMVEADPAPPPRRAVRSEPVPLQAKGADVARLLFASPAVGQAAVLSAPEVNPLAPQRRVRFDRYDLTTGQALAGDDLFVTAADTAGLAADFSPDGTRLLVREPAEGRRLDVWSADGKHLAGWLPYSAEPPPAGRVAWAAFVDSRRVLTASAAGRLILWRVPECRAEYVADGYPGGWTLSPGRRYLTAFNGQGLAVLEAVTGVRRGCLGWPDALRGAACVAAAFRPDGNEVAAVLREANGPAWLVRWDWPRGVRVAAFPFQAEPAAGLRWCGAAALLHGLTLLDLKQGLALWRYQLPGPGIPGSTTPDGRLWYTAHRKADESAVLMAQALPDTAAATAARLLSQPAAVLFRPGQDVRLEVTIDGQPADKHDFTKVLRDRLGHLGIKTAVQAPCTLTAAICERRSKLSCRLGLVDDRNTAFWEQEWQQETADPHAYARRALWSALERWVARVPLPACAVRRGSTVQFLPGASVLPAAGR
jgi:hypothetical protein